MKRTKINALLQAAEVGKKVVASGWVRTKRPGKNVTFIALNDGSTIKNLQVVADADKISEEVLKNISTGACISVIGMLAESPGSGQAVELQANEIEVLGTADPDEFPLQKKRHSLEYLREIAHLRTRTNTFGAVMRIRHALAFAVHQFFNDKGFVYWHSPIITGSDCEGAGEMFRVTTFELNNAPTTEDGSIDFKKDFFGKETNLTVSGQLEAELGALALSEVYTFGPTFRAENSNTSRHLSEFWMLEPEMVFYDISDNMDLAEEFLKYAIQHVLDNCPDDLEFLNQRKLDEEKQKPQQQRSEMELIESLKFIVENEFVRLTYTEAIEILMRSKPNQKKKFEFVIEKWGADFQSEHERYLVEKHFKKPLIITDYPKEIKAFYMYRNDDGKTVRGMDILFPGIGEIVGGSQREHRYEQLLEGISDFDIDKETIWWYLETRKFGTAPHSGFGLGFERFVQYVTGMHNIRDVIPFPRSPQNAEF